MGRMAPLRRRDTLKVAVHPVEARFARRVENKLVGRFAGIPGAAEKRIGANACRRSICAQD
jgi:hypothetical protein